MTADTPGDTQTAGSALDRFRAIVFADADLQVELAQRRDPAAFAELAARRARERGVGLDVDAVRHAAVADPLGVSRWDDQPLSQDWPEGDWLPVHAEGGPEPYVDWAQFAGAPLTAPFFEESRRKAAVLPFNAAFRRRTSLAGFIAAATPERTRTPRGLIFHMSRCGSTLVAQMLAASSRNTVISEAPPLDAAVQIEAFGTPSGRCDGVLAAMVSALGRRWPAEDDRLFIKHDSWHAMSLALIRRTYPRAPWVFLYRDPLEVMVSQARQAGVQTVPGMLPPHLFGIDPEEMPPDAYGAAALGRTCGAAVDAFAHGGGLLVNYRELPDAVYTRILPHFGVTPDAEDLAAMARTAGRDAKAPYAAFAPDGEAKRREATPRLFELVDRYLTAPYRRLEALRAGNGSGVT